MALLCERAVLLSHLQRLILWGLQLTMAFALIITRQHYSVDVALGYWMAISVVELIRV